MPAAPDAALPEPLRDAGIASVPVWIEGPLLRAASAALGDFVSRRQYELAGMAEPDPVTACLARPEAYDVQVVAELDDRFVVFVLPRPDRCFDGALLGADATYEVSKRDFAILSASLGE